MMQSKKTPSQANWDTGLSSAPPQLEQDLWILKSRWAEVSLNIQAKNLSKQCWVFLKHRHWFSYWKTKQMFTSESQLSLAWCMITTLDGLSEYVKSCLSSLFLLVIRHHNVWYPLDGTSNQWSILFISVILSSLDCKLPSSAEYSM